MQKAELRSRPGSPASSRGGMSELEDPLVADGSINSGTLGPEKPAVAVVVAFGAAIGAVVFGYSLGFSSPALPGMEADVFSHDVTCGKDNAVDSETASLWSSIVNVGCMVGAIVGAKILEKFGRRGALWRGRRRRCCCCCWYRRDDRR